MEQPYLDHLRAILDEGVERGDRTGVGTRSLFGLQTRYRLTDGFPAVTTKKLAWKTLVSELLWFISGSGNLNDLKAIYRHNRIWDENYAAWRERKGGDGADGDMGRVYGLQWRRWRTADGREIDQLADAIEMIRHQPDSRRIIVNAWNPGEASPDDVALPPCHSFFQFYTAGDRLSLQMYQRSGDMFLGVPFNIASYALLLHMVARITGRTAFEFVHVIGDAHIYLNHIDAVRTQLALTPFTPPTLRIEDRGQQNIDAFRMSDFHLDGYECHPPIAAPMAV